MARIMEKWPGSESSNMRFCLSVPAVFGWSASVSSCVVACGIDLRGLEGASFAVSTVAFALRDMMDGLDCEDVD
jgi:hypothetical protein